MPIFGRFDDRARRTIDAARNAAITLRHRTIGTEHLLCGLLKEARDEAPALPKNLSLAAVQYTITQLVGQEDTPPQMLELSARMKKVLEDSVGEAQRRGAQNVSSAHIWISLLNAEDSTAARVLNILGIDLERVRQSVAEAMAERESHSEEGQEEGSLSKYSRDLTQLAREGKVDPVIGRDKEIERIVQILSRRTKNNPVLIGEPGVGKSAVAEGLAQRIIDGSIPDMLHGKKLISLDIGSLVAGTKYRGEFEERMKNVLEEIKGDPDIILFIDELQKIVGAGKAEGSIDAAGILAGPRPGRAPVHRRHHPGRLQEAHRKGRRALPPIPAGHGGSAHAGRVAGHIEGPAQALRGPSPRAAFGRGPGGGGAAVRPLYPRALPARQGGGPDGRGGVARPHQHIHRRAGPERQGGGAGGHPAAQAGRHRLPGL